MTSNQNAIDTVTVAGGDSAFREVLGTPVYQKRKIYTRLDSCCCSSSLWGQVSTMTFGLLRQGWLVTEAQVCFSWVYKKNVFSLNHTKISQLVMHTSIGALSKEERKWRRKEKKRETRRKLWYKLLSERSQPEEGHTLYVSDSDKSIKAKV